MRTWSSESVSFSNAGRTRVVDLHVVLDGLSPLARWLAEVILTTERADCAGHVTVRERASNEQIMRATPRAAWEESDIEKYIALVDQAHPGYLQTREQWTWDWDCLRRGETAEQYFERHAAEMLARQVDVVHGPNFGKYVGRMDPPPPTVLRVLSAGTPEATA